jgi:DNA primase
MGFIEAVKDLAGQYGMEVPEDDRSPQDRERAAKEREKQTTLSDVLEKAGEAYRKHLRNSPRAIGYLKGRGLTGEIAKRFGLGYAPEGWRSLASVFPKYDDPLLEESGLVIAGEEDKRYDRFRDRVMFPIRNVKGECIGFGGRVLGDEKPKYLNSPETPVFSKGRELYGLFEARNHLREFGYVLVTEGYMDVVALAQLGFPNAVATLGTACTPDHVHKLFRFTDSVVFSFDGDAAGRRAARKALEGALGYATDVRSIKFLFLPAEHDPDTFIREFGTDAFAREVAQATPLSRFLIEAASEGCDLLTAEGRAHMASNAKPLWMALPDGALKLQLLTDIAAHVQLGTHELQSLWGLAGNRKPPTSPSRSPAPQRSPRPPLRAGLARRADIALRHVLGDSAAWESLSQEDHDVLCDLPDPHGALFRWLDSRVHDQGPQAWGKLFEDLQSFPGSDFANQLMSSRELKEMAPADVESELRGLLNGLLAERLRAQETEAAAEISVNPEAKERYLALQARRKALEAQLIPNRNP